MNCDLSILIPSRLEMFLKNTVEDILKHREADTEVIAVLDGSWADPQLVQNDRVNVIYVNPAVGQRAAANLAAKIARGKYVMKVDAHCSFDQGFDRKMIEGFKKIGEDVVMVPVMRNLHAFNWKCKKCGNEWYQGPTPEWCCSDKKGKVRNEKCDSTEFERKIYWIGKSNPQSVSYCFDSEPHFNYFNDYKKREKYQKEVETGFTETMSLQGSAFMSTKDLYWEIDLGGETYGNWGNQGVSVACHTWLSGHRVLCNHSTWYAHLFRTQGSDFSFPWPNSGREVQKTKQNVKEAVWSGTLPHQKHKLSWLIERFWPVPGWDDDDLAKLKELEDGG